MSWSRGFLYWTVALLLGSLLWSGAQQEDAVDGTADAERAPILALVRERVDRVVVESKGRTIEIARGGDGRWVVREPAGTEVPHDIVEAVIETLSSVPVIESVSDDTDSDRQFGLDPAEMKVRFEVAGTVVGNLALGRPNPTRTAFYARRVGEDRVFLLGLNSKYYLDLIGESVSRFLRLQLADEAADPALEPLEAAGVEADAVKAAAADAAAVDAAPADSGAEDNGMGEPADGVQAP